MSTEGSHGIILVFICVISFNPFSAVVVNSALCEYTHLVTVFSQQIGLCGPEGNTQQTTDAEPMLD